jgi:hypothetical protein
VGIAKLLWRQHGDQPMRNWLRLAMRPDVVARGLKIALIVGTILTAINQGDLLVSGTITTGILTKILLNYFVPFGVSIYTDVNVLVKQQRE